MQIPSNHHEQNVTHQLVKIMGNPSTLRFPATHATVSYQTLPWFLQERLGKGVLKSLLFTSHCPKILRPIFSKCCGRGLLVKRM